MGIEFTIFADWCPREEFSNSSTMVSALYLSYAGIYVICEVTKCVCELLWSRSRMSSTLNSYNLPCHILKALSYRIFLAYSMSSIKSILRRKAFVFNNVDRAKKCIASEHLHPVSFQHVGNHGFPQPSIISSSK